MAVDVDASIPTAGGEDARSAPWWQPPSLSGACVAVLLTTVSFTPSLLPRGAVAQGIVCGINAALGYGIGVGVAAIWRALVDRAPRPTRPATWRMFGVVTVVVLVVALVLGWRWQGELRGLMDAPQPAVWTLLLVPLVAVPIAAGILAVGRSLRRASHALTRLLARRIGARPAVTLGRVLVGVLAWTVVSGVLVDGFVAVADRAFATRDTGTHDGVTAPVSERRSGGPGSAIAWDGLGRQGRRFVSGGPTTLQIGGIRGDGGAQEPIRAFAGIVSAEDVEARARAAVDDLERAGGFRRAHLLVATTTGTGWLDPGAIASFEYVTRGDAATVAMQYSYLPSWLSYFVDQQRARQAGRELFDAVYERWLALPADERPALHVFGESLGSFGAEAAFSGEFDLRNRTDGALFVGPPAFNVLHHDFTADRDPGSPQAEPVHRGGRTVRFTNLVSEPTAPTDQSWDGTRVLYLQHPSDPIVWWSPEVAYRRPDWLREPRGRDVLDEVVWIPLVTFWQLTGDLPFAVDVPAGHGHRYTAESVDAWATVLRPDDWTAEHAARVVEAVTLED